MPPTRTIPPAKAVKTERTHEENQERAYIAASRRSDRSLEARVESARRASEIHKRRTGRSLRVTEQDVINEEMYEEEDDDLPLQYRRLTAHLQTGSADFNRRLAAYLTNQVAMRSAIGHMANGPYGPQYPHPGPYPPGMFPSPMIPQQQHQLPQSPGGTYRQAPYPSPHHPAFRQMHGRAYSMTGPAKTSNPPTPMSSASLDHRRMSTPASVHPGAPAPINTEDARPDFDYVRQTQSATIPHGGYATWQDMGPFTATLPPESQQMLAGAPGFDPNDPMSAMLLHGSESFMSNPYYPWGEMQTGIKGMPVHPSAYAGMSATLAPAALEVTNNESTTATPTTSGPTTIDGSAPSSGLDLGFSTDTKGLGLNVPGAKRDHSPHSLASGQVTPGEGFWDHFVQDGSWYDDNATLSS